MAWESERKPIPEWAVTRGGKGRVVLPAPEETKLSRGGSARVALPTAEARRGVQHHQRRPAGSLGGGWRPGAGRYARPKRPAAAYPSRTHGSSRSEEHTSELQSPDHLVCRLLLEKKKRKCRTSAVIQQRKWIERMLMVYRDTCVSLAVFEPG